MRILALDTSAATKSVALFDDGSIIAEHNAYGKRTHAETLLPIIERLMSDADWRVDTLDAICYTEGAGSYTGLRIAKAMAQGIAAPYDTPTLGVSTLHALAYPYLVCTHTVVPMLDARSARVYMAVYVDGQCVFTDAAIALKDAAERKIVPDGALLIGEGVTVNAALLRELLPDALHASACSNHVRAGTVAILAAQQLTTTRQTHKNLRSLSQ